MSGSLEDLAALWRGRRAAVLTGAGVSTESGIPDYRGPQTRHRPRSPIQYRAFVGDPAARARYWARSAIGWPRFRDFQPNPAHHALASLQRAGRLTRLITQNVDRLHHKAGSANVIELHGALAGVVCLACGAEEPRDAVQLRIEEHNPGFASQAAELAPDGDVDLPEAVVRSFRVPGCAACGGVLKPDVVLFGESVPRPRVEAAYAELDAAELLVVIGSSLAVFSGYRFVLRAQEQGKPVALLNLGESRGDAAARVRVEARAGEALPRLAGLIG